MNAVTVNASADHDLSCTGIIGPFEADISSNFFLPGKYFPSPSFEIKKNF